MVYCLMVVAVGVENVIENSNIKNNQNFKNRGIKSFTNKTYADVVRSNIKQQVKQ